ncbi:hypothetical protein [Polymorphobacter megasporae]|uniref:hypothetical protein n=1 Tax=Glacieibacterium megasporae TaxID=2835787 RepID=UPI001C1E49A5|nr:hypothetical protein [Polymorphobacter megasporae]UAJ10823.1 hypothetical protein KTC28_03580 [Polymorphobacter megasporae]
MAFFKTLTLAAAAAIAFSGTANAGEMVRSGTITIDEAQFGFLIGGSTGGGVLRFHGHRYSFKVGGVSIGTIGGSKVKGFGTVYNLRSIEDFAGTYSKLNASATLVDGSGALKLKNEHDVVLEIDTTSKGLQLSAGAGGVKITLK